MLMLGGVERLMHIAHEMHQEDQRLQRWAAGRLRSASTRRVRVICAVTQLPLEQASFTSKGLSMSMS
jgi:hypothetical protein